MPNDQRHVLCFVSQFAVLVINHSINQLINQSIIFSIKSVEIPKLIDLENDLEIPSEKKAFCFLRLYFLSLKCHEQSIDDAPKLNAELKYLIRNNTFLRPNM